MALVISTWHWGKKYPISYVEKLHNSVERNLRQPHRFCVFSPHEDDVHLTTIPGCFCRLRMFSPEWQQERNLSSDDRMVCLDLDIVITDLLDPLFDRPETFCILKGANSSNPCPFNGSVMMLRPGCHADVWDDFSLEKAKAVPFHSFPDDQGWLHHKLPNAAGWQVGKESGIYAFRKPGWSHRGDYLPDGARMVVFPGSNDPGRLRHVAWVDKHWR